jgi:tetratricopeptide (TPR) repeat protein
VYFNPTLAASISLIGVLLGLVPPTLPAQSTAADSSGIAVRACQEAGHGVARKAACRRALGITTSPIAQYLFAVEYLRSQEWLQALLAFQRASNLDQQYNNQRRDLGLYWLHRSQTDTLKVAVAIGTLDSASMETPADPDVMYARAAAYSIARQWSMAAQIYHDLLSSGEDDDARVYYGLAEAYEGLGNLEQALVAYRLASNSHEPKMRANCLAALARINVIVGRPAIALEYWKRALALDPSVAERRDYQMLYPQSLKNAGLIERPDTQDLSALRDSTSAATSTVW